jgi:peptidoglycan hydrolase-like protein with peptidoglycan-binding domain
MRIAMTLGKTEVHMNWHVIAVSALGAALLGPPAVAQSVFTSLHPEEAIPDPQGEVTPGAHSDFIKRVQERLHQEGFDAGPVNGYFGEKTQAALAQFQLGYNVPASGSLDDDTLAALGLQRDTQASAGASGAQPTEQPSEEGKSAEQPAAQQPAAQQPAAQQPAAQQPPAEQQPAQQAPMDKPAEQKAGG